VCPELEGGFRRRHQKKAMEVIDQIVWDVPTLPWATWLLKMTKRKPNPFSIEFPGIPYTTSIANIKGAIQPNPKFSNLAS
jgi:hypothetical protein